MKTLAKTKKQKKPNYYRQQWVLPDWVFRRILKPLAIVVVFLLGAGAQLVVPFLELPKTVTNYAPAQLTAHELYQIDEYTCDAITRRYDLFNAEQIDQQQFISQAKQELAIMSLVTEPWANYAGKADGQRDWHENTAVVWKRILTFAETYDQRKEQWFGELEPSLDWQPTFIDFMVQSMASREQGRLSDWMILVKYCVFDRSEPKVTPIEVVPDEGDAFYCKIYARVESDDWSSQLERATYASSKLTTVANRGNLSHQWTQMESGLHAYLNVLGDRNYPFTTFEQWKAAKETEPLKVLRNRLDMLCS